MSRNFTDAAVEDAGKEKTEAMRPTAEDEDFSKEPPNILVYANDNEAYFESIRDTLLSCLKKDR